MDEKLLDRLEKMLKSHDKEMRLLAVTIFTQESKSYEDYSKLRLRFPFRLDDPINLPMEHAFNEMYKVYSSEHIQEKFREYADNWKYQRMHDLQTDKVSSLDKTDVIKKTVRYYTKDQQNAARNNKN